MKQRQQKPCNPACPMPQKCARIATILKRLSPEGELPDETDVRMTISLDNHLQSVVVQDYSIGPIEEFPDTIGVHVTIRDGGVTHKLSYAPPKKLARV